MSTPDLGDPSTWSPIGTNGIDAAALFNERTWLAGAMLSSVAYGVVLTLSIQCIHLLTRNMNRSNYRQNLPFLIYVIIMFIVGTLFVGADSKMTELSFIDNRNFPGGPSMYEVLEFSVAPSELGNVAFVIANWLADGLVVWRGIVIYRGINPSPYVAMAIPILMYIASLVLGSLWTKQVSAPAGSPWAPGFNSTLPYLCTSLSLNMLVSLMIVVRLLYYRYRVAKTLGASHGAQYTSIVAMIIESAALYSTCSLIFIVPFVKNHPIQNTFLQLLAEVQIAAPLLIIFRVAQGKAWSSNTSTQVLSTWKTNSAAPSSQYRMAKISSSKMSAGMMSTDSSRTVTDSRGVVVAQDIYKGDLEGGARGY